MSTCNGDQHGIDLFLLEHMTRTERCLDPPSAADYDA